MNKFKKFITSRSFQIWAIRSSIYLIIFIVVLHFMFKIFWGETLLDILN
jgi:hypothetical protein